jgi:glycerol kinase
MESYILAFDAGTTSSRAILFNRTGRVVAISQKEFEQLYPQPGWVEHNPEEIWATQKFVARDVLRKANVLASQVAAIGITNQRETTLVWHRETGEPLFNAIVWQDRRTAAACDQLRRDGHAGMIQHKTGLVPDAYFSATKVKWILDHVEGARSLADHGKLAFGTVDSWLLWRLTGAAIHRTDVTNASRTMLYNIRELRWDPELLALFEIPSSMMPEVLDSGAGYGHTLGPILGSSVPIGSMIGDQQAALFGQMCTTKGMVKNTYGTGCFVMMNIGGEAVLSGHNLLTTIAWKFGNQLSYALEGSIFIGGAVVQWLRDNLNLVANAGEIEALAATVPDNGGVYLVPAFAGLGAPHWDPYARGAILGLTRGATKGHIARAALESIALQSADVIETMQLDSGIPVAELRVDGGASVNNLLMQIQADLSGVPVVRPDITETTALGAAFLAGLQVGFWSGTDELQKVWAENRRFLPGPGSRDSGVLKKGWKKALQRAAAWVED